MEIFLKLPELWIKTSKTHFSTLFVCSTVHSMKKSDTDLFLGMELILGLFLDYSIIITKNEYWTLETSQIIKCQNNYIT